MAPISKFRRHAVQPPLDDNTDKSRARQEMEQLLARYDNGAMPHAVAAVVERLRIEAGLPIVPTGE